MNSFDSYMTPRDRAEGEKLSCSLNDRGGISLTRQEMVPRPDDGLCGCRGDGNSSPYGLGNCGGTYPLAMVYSPAQAFDNLFDTPEEGLFHGTIFRQLCLPFLPNDNHRGGKCR